MHMSLHLIKNLWKIIDKFVDPEGVIDIDKTLNLLPDRAIYDNDFIQNLNYYNIRTIIRGIRKYYFKTELDNSLFSFYKGKLIIFKLMTKIAMINQNLPSIVLQNLKNEFENLNEMSKFAKTAEAFQIRIFSGSRQPDSFLFRSAVLPVFPAPFPHRALIAERALSLADSASVPDQPMMCPSPFFHRNQLRHLRFCFFRGACRAEAKPVAYAKHVGIHRKGRNPKSVGKRNIRGLSPNAGKLGQRLQAARNFPAMLLPDDFAGCDNVTRLVPEPAALNHGLQLFHRRFGHRRGIRIPGKNGRSHPVHLTVRALSGKDCRHQRLIRIGEMQLRPCFRIGLLQALQNSLLSLFFCHHAPHQTFSVRQQRAEEIRHSLRLPKVTKGPSACMPTSSNCRLSGKKRPRPCGEGASLYFLEIRYPFRVSSSAVRMPPPAAPRIVL
jgi:hypothetical protein